MKKKIILMCLIILIACPLALLASEYIPPPPSVPDFQNVWSDLYGTSFEFFLPNAPDPNGIKTVWFHMMTNNNTFESSVTTEYPYPVEIIQKTLYENLEGTGMFMYTWIFTLTPQPSSETVHIDFGNYQQGLPLPQIMYASMVSHCDTVPIPGALWLLGSGLVGLAGLRRRFKK
jgi:hypothetical protein